MKKCLVLFIVLTASITAYTQVVIGFGPKHASEDEPNGKLRSGLIKKSYVLNFLHFRGDSIPDTMLIQQVISIHSDNNNFCVLYKDDTTKIAIEIEKLKSQNGYSVTTFGIKGNIRRISNYDKNLLLSGKWVEYYTNRSVKEIGEYKNGKKINTWKYYNASGYKTLTETYKKSGEVLKKNANLKE
jgi:antitoxin component YwqK of YwqJK toxin-antitoxin module